MDTDVERKVARLLGLDRERDEPEYQRKLAAVVLTPEEEAVAEQLGMDLALLREHTLLDAEEGR